MPRAEGPRVAIARAYGVGTPFGMGTLAGVPVAYAHSDHKPQFSHPLGGSKRNVRTRRLSLRGSRTRGVLHQRAHRLARHYCCLPPSRSAGCVWWGQCRKRCCVMSPGRKSPPCCPSCHETAEAREHANADGRNALANVSAWWHTHIPSHSLDWHNACPTLHGSCRPWCRIIAQTPWRGRPRKEHKHGENNWCCTTLHFVHRSQALWQCRRKMCANPPCLTKVCSLAWAEVGYAPLLTTMGNIIWRTANGR